MISEKLVAAILGGLLSAIKYRNRDCIIFMQAWISGTALAWFAGDDVIRLIAHSTDIVLSVGVVYFLLSYTGAAMLEKSLVFIKAFQVSKLWK